MESGHYHLNGTKGGGAWSFEPLFEEL
jgi:hypothetical protein